MKEKKVYSLSVYWQMHSTMKIEAESLDDAIQKAMDAPLPVDGEYLDGSFEVDTERLAMDYPDEEHLPNTRVNYIYRDAANYKIPLHVVLPGSLTSKQMDDIWDYSEEFRPADFGFPADTFVSRGYRPYDDDPDTHEITEVEETDEEPTVEITADEFYNRLVKNTHNTGAEEAPNIVCAKFVSYWDCWSSRVETDCKVNLDTHEVFDVERVSPEDFGACLDALDAEEVVIDGTAYCIFPKNEAKEGDFWYDA